MFAEDPKEGAVEGFLVCIREAGGHRGRGWEGWRPLRDFEKGKISQTGLLDYGVRLEVAERVAPGSQ